MSLSPAGDGDAFAKPFAENADFVNIRGEHHRTRAAIAAGHHAILSTIYKSSSVRFEIAAIRAIAPGVLLAHVKALNAPVGPLAGGHHARFSMVPRAERRRLVDRRLSQHAGELAGAFCVLPFAFLFSKPAFPPDVTPGERPPRAS